MGREGCSCPGLDLGSLNLETQDVFDQSPAHLTHVRPETAHTVDQARAASPGQAGLSMTCFSK